jgi:hypothetical protein
MTVTDASGLFSIEPSMLPFADPWSRHEQPPTDTGHARSQASTTLWFNPGT